MTEPMWIAQDAAPRFARSLRAGKMMAPGSTALALSHAEPSIANMLANDYYVFNATDNSAFVIVAGDDRAEEILAYGEGIIDMSNLPCNLRWRLSQYKEQMEFLFKNPKLEVRRMSDNASSMLRATTVSPLLTCIWDQDAPFWDQCPTYNNQNCYTGCVATAMAQVMYYWKYPNTLPALPSYRTYSNNLGGTQATGHDTGLEQHDQ